MISSGSNDGPSAKKNVKVYIPTDQLKFACCLKTWHVLETILYLFIIICAEAMYFARKNN